MVPYGLFIIGVCTEIRPNALMSAMARMVIYPTVYRYSTEVKAVAVGENRGVENLDPEDPGTSGILLSCGGFGLKEFCLTLQSAGRGRRVHGDDSVGVDGGALNSSAGPEHGLYILDQPHCDRLEELQLMAPFPSFLLSALADRQKLLSS